MLYSGLMVIKSISDWIFALTLVATFIILGALGVEKLLVKVFDSKK